MVDLIALKSFTYARQALRAGDRFAAHDSDVRLLLAIGQAVRPEAEPAFAPARPPAPRPEPPPPPDDPVPGPGPELPPTVPDPAAETFSDRVRRVIPKPKPRKR
jgi:hypothetical protein